MYGAAELLQLIEDRRLELGLSQADVGLRAFGKPDNTAIQNLKKGSAPSMERLAALANALDLELYLGPRRDLAAPLPPLAIEGEDFATIKRVAAEASAGAGAVNGEVEVVGALAFRRDWLRERGIKPERALLVTVTGDSMSPRIEKGDLVLLDLNRTQVANGEPHVFVDIDGDTRLKRLHRLGRNTLAIVSDNPAYLPELRHGADAERVKVLGRVVWSGHNWG